MSELFDDVKAATQVFGRELERHEGAQTADISAIERGVRQRPDGTREDYERIEFSRPQPS